MLALHALRLKTRGLADLEKQVSPFSRAADEGHGPGGKPALQRLFKGEHMDIGVTLVALDAFENPFKVFTGAFKRLGKDAEIENESAGDAERGRYCAAPIAESTRFPPRYRPARPESDCGCNRQGDRELRSLIDSFHSAAAAAALCLRD